MHCKAKSNFGFGASRDTSGMVNWIFSPKGLSLLCMLSTIYLLSYSVLHIITSGCHGNLLSSNELNLNLIDNKN